MRGVPPSWWSGEDYRLAVSIMLRKLMRGAVLRDSKRSGMTKVGILRATERLFAFQEALLSLEVFVVGSAPCLFGSSIFIF